MSAAIEVGLGLAFTYFLFATLASGANELIARVLNSRGRALFSAINALIGDADLAVAFWDQELVKSVGRARAPRSRAGRPNLPGELWPAKGAKDALFEQPDPDSPGPVQRSVNGAQARALPSYIAPHTFALALVQARKQLAQPAPPASASAAAGPQPQPSAVDQVVNWAMAITAAAATPPAGAGSGSGGSSGPGAGAAPEHPVEAYGQVVIDHLVAWFNGAMDRLSGMYKRRAQLILLGISVVAIGAFNLNTVHIASELWQDPTLRAQVAASAQAATSTRAASSPSSPATASTCTLGPSGNSGSVACAIAEAKTLPIGWAALNTPKGGFGTDGWFWAVIGWLLSLGALALGAPFWFNMLTKLNSMRSTGPPPSASSSPSSG